MDLQNIDIRFDEPMSRHTSFAIGGPAKMFARPKDKDELIFLLKEYPGAFVMGNGSNLLVSDNGFPGMIISTTAMRSAERIYEYTIEAQCGALLSSVSSFALKLGLSGLEFASGIPGTVGGGVYMNAGAYGEEMSNVINSTLCWDGSCERTVTSHDFAYRCSIYSVNQGWIVLSAAFTLTGGNSGEIRAKSDELNAKRRSKQPLEWPSAGSVFKRPAKDIFAGGLIERCGLKGFQIGGAKVSEKHAGFIINAGSASCDDVRKLIAHVQETVLRETGISLEPEIKFLGD